MSFAGAFRKQNFFKSLKLNEGSPELGLGLVSWFGDGGAMRVHQP